MAKETTKKTLARESANRDGGPEPRAAAIMPRRAE
jgi:hypothetical protein